MTGGSLQAQVRWDGGEGVRGNGRRVDRRAGRGTDKPQRPALRQEGLERVRSRRPSGQPTDHEGQRDREGIDPGPRGQLEAQPLQNLTDEEDGPCCLITTGRQQV